MSVDRNVYVGPYLRVTDQTEERSEDRCAGHNRAGDTYCPVCGLHVVNQFRTTRVSRNAPEHWWEQFRKNGAPAELNDYLIDTAQMCAPEPAADGSVVRLYLPNRHWDQLGVPDLETEREVPYDHLDVLGSVARFMKLFAEEIAFLEQWFTVEVRFGVVIHYS